MTPHPPPKLLRSKGPKVEQWPKPEVESDLMEHFYAFHESIFGTVQHANGDMTLVVSPDAIKAGQAASDRKSLTPSYEISEAELGWSPRLSRIWKALRRNG